MAIPISDYVEITSGVGNGTSVAARELIGRIFTINPLVSPTSVLEFTSLTAVGDYFGETSEEFLRAQFYFNWISKTIRSPQKISFSRFVPVAVAPMIFGATLIQSLAQLKTITAGTFKITIDGVSGTVTGLDLSGAANLAAIAALIQTAVRAVGSGTQFTAATVSYDATKGAFNLIGGSAVTADISIDYTLPNDISAALGWQLGAVFTSGSIVQSITDTLNSSINISNNFGSFIFTTSCGLVLSQVTEAATWNVGQNVMYQYYVPVTAANASTWSAALFLKDGTGMTGDPQVTGEYPEMDPMLIMAATDYLSRNSTKNYMYQIFQGQTPFVTTEANKELYDGLRINYYGQTQQAGQPLSFYQIGQLCGRDTAPLDMNTYANEQWLKDAVSVELLNLFLAVDEIPANSEGRSLILTAIQNIIDIALFNGTISLGKTLTNSQKAYIISLTNDDTSWFQIQNSGYWINCTIDPVTNVASYLLIYSKDDIVRKIEGTHVLI